MKNVNSDVAYNYIREKILDGEFAPGQALMTEVLAKEIKVSRTPIRDALRKLESDGLVTIRAHFGASVKQMQLKEFREMCDLRLALESHAAGLAATNRTESDLREIRRALEAMRKLTIEINSAKQEQPLMNELVREDVRFHIEIIAASKNELMKKEILRLHLINRVAVGPPMTAQVTVPKADSDQRRSAALVMHDRIYTAIAKADPLVSRREMEYHLQEMITHNLALMTRAENVDLARELTFRLQPQDS
jgi:DNA-binding GntR family transcriptional regulator